LFGMLASCQQQTTNALEQENEEGIVYISGTIENSAADWLLIYPFCDVPNLAEADTLFINGNSFFGKIDVPHPDRYRLEVNSNHDLFLILGDGNIHLKLDARNSTGSPFKYGAEEIEGSPESKLLNKIIQTKTNVMQEMQALKPQYLQARSNNDLERMRSIQMKQQQIYTGLADKLLQIIKGQQPSLASIEAMSSVGYYDYSSLIDSLAARLVEKYPNSCYANLFAEQIGNLGSLAIGASAPTFMLPANEGDSISLQDFRGKYVLVDFWASWCKPCRQENPNIVRAYQEFKNRNFEVLGVSLDRTRDPWLQAISQDGLTWPQVLSIPNSPGDISPVYQIESIPFNVLLDPQGKIIARELRGPELRNTLARILPAN